MIIIGEGPDRTGKTNLLQELSKELHVPYFKFSGEARCWNNQDDYSFVDALRYDQTYISEFLLQTGHDVIFDRAYPSEFVYSRVYTRKTDFRILKAVDESFAKMKATILLLLKDDYTHSEPDPLVENEKLQAIHNMYVDFAEFTKCNVVTVYVKGEEFRQVELRNIVSAIRYIDSNPSKKCMVTVRL